MAGFTFGRGWFNIIGGLFRSCFRWLYVINLFVFGEGSKAKKGKSQYNTDLVNTVPQTCLWQANKTGGYTTLVNKCKGTEKQRQLLEMMVEARSQKQTKTREREFFRFHIIHQMCTAGYKTQGGELIVSGVYVSATAIGLFTFSLQPGAIKENNDISATTARSITQFELFNDRPNDFLYLSGLGLAFYSFYFSFYPSSYISLLPPLV